MSLGIPELTLNNLKGELICFPVIWRPKLDRNDHEYIVIVMSISIQTLNL